MQTDTFGSVLPKENVSEDTGSAKLSVNVILEEMKNEDA